MKKKIKDIFKILLTIILIIPICICDVRADDSTGGNTSGESAGSIGNSDAGNAVDGSKGSYTNAYVGLRITLVDSKGNRIKDTISVDYLSEDSLDPESNFYYSYQKKDRKEIVASGETKWKTISASNATFNKLNFINFLKEKNSNLMENYFEEYFKSMDSKTFKSILNTLAGGNYDSVTSYDALIKDGTVCRTVQEGYMLIEPLVKVWIGGTVQKHYFGTATEIIQVINDNLSSAEDISGKTAEHRFPYSIYLPNTSQSRIDLANTLGFIAISVPGEDKRFKKVDTLKQNVQGTKIYGVGVGAFKISNSGIDLPCSKCWTTETTCDKTTCVNTNLNNERTCQKTVKEIDCEYGENEEKVNQSGEKMFTYGNGCNLYCTEKAIASYPGNVYPRVELGTKLVWPTANGEGVYPLITKGTLTCTITPNSGVSMDYCISEAQKTNFKYNTSASGKLTYNDLSKDVAVSLKGTCSTSQNVNGTIVTITNSCNYSLADKSYNAFNKDTLQAVELDKSAFAKADNYILTKERILSIGNINKTLYSDLAKVLDGEYKLQISDLSLGHDNQFTSELNKTAYVCKYQVTDEAKAQNECSCPPGTEQAGQNLLGTIIRINGEATSESQMITCAEAQHLYCNCSGGDCPDNPDENPVCPSNTAYPGISLAGCISDGNSESECIKNNCYEYCPLESDKPGQDISTCIKDYMSKGKDKWKAYDLCVEKEKCYNPCHGAACIIYRTISLEVPFVGKSASTSLKSTFINIGLSQGLDLYRYPGSNWNSPSLVYNKIWNNRGYKASELYQEATPLYTINLDPTSIKTIREYNKTHEYSDFTLSCTDGAYCISSFLRSGIKNADKTDILDATASTCANASNKTTFISCYTSK